MEYVDVDIDETKPFVVASIPSEKSVVTGVIGRGACFIHALLHCMSPKEYRAMSQEDRIEFVIEFRKLLAKSITYEEWLEIPGIELTVQSQLKKVVAAFYKKSDSVFLDQVTYKTYAEFLRTKPYETIFDVREFDVEEYKKRLIAVLGGTHKLANFIMNQAMKTSYERFQREIADEESNISDTTFRVIGKKFETFVIFINKDTGSVYKNVKIDRSDIESYRYAVLLRYDGGHFESIGIVDDTNTIIRLFMVDDTRIEPLLEQHFE